VELWLLSAPVCEDCFSQTEVAQIVLITDLDSARTQQLAGESIFPYQFFLGHETL